MDASKRLAGDEYMKPHWKADELDYLYQKYPHKENPLSQIALSLNKSEKSIKCQACRLGLKRRYEWSEAEVVQLREMAGEMPRSLLYKAYNKWASTHGLPTRHPSTIENKIKKTKISGRLNCAADWYTSADIASFLGCKQDTVSHWLKQYHQELKPIEAAQTRRKLAVSRYRFRQFLISHPLIVERHRRTVDLVWLMDLLGER